MIENVFSENLLVGFIVTVVMIISFSNFEENQHVSLIYLLVYGLGFFRITRLWVCGLFVFISTFVFLEYLTNDKKKLGLITKIRFKIYDHLYRMFFQMCFFGFLLSLILLFFSHILVGYYSLILKALSLIVLFLTEHRAITQPFKIATISEMCKPFDLHPLYMYTYDEEIKKRYEMVCYFEDRSFFSREKSYSIVSIEYIKLYGLGKAIKKLLKLFFKKKNGGVQKQGFVKRAFGRGYSTPEMQLIRTTGVIRGYDKYVISRKIFEVVYSKIVFSSLKVYLNNNSGLEGLVHFREYLLDVYLKTVNTKIDKIRTTKFCESFKNGENIATWPLEGVFVASLGLSHRKVNKYNLDLFSNVIEIFDLDREKIYEYKELIRKNDKIPCYSSRKKKRGTHDQL